MNNPIYTSPLKDHIKSYVELKQAIGYKYKTQADHLKHFDNFIVERYPETTLLTKEIVLEWCRKRVHETQSNQCVRTSHIRRFGKYLDSIGIKSYILPKGYCPAAKQYTPYIYTTEELIKFFAQTDQCQYCPKNPNRHLIMPVIFRMLYKCGLRLSEARLLKVRDVDLERGVLTIHHSKNDKSRLVPMSDCLAERCREFSKNVHSNSLAEDYYFAALGGKPMTKDNFYQNFRIFLWKARISHRGQGPRVHDFRHTFAVHCLKQWVEQEKDLAAYLPILKTYMGHDTFTETAYYLRMTADVFPYITLKMESYYLDIIPQLEENSHEAY